LCRRSVIRPSKAFSAPAASASTPSRAHRGNNNRGRECTAAGRQFLLHPVRIVAITGLGRSASCMNSATLRRKRRCVRCAVQPYMRPDEVKMLGPRQSIKEAHPFRYHADLPFDFDRVRGKNPSLRAACCQPWEPANPSAILMVVIFRRHFGPRKPKNCPVATWRSMASTAVRFPKVRVSFGSEGYLRHHVSAVRPRKSEGEL